MCEIYLALFKKRYALVRLNDVSNMNNVFDTLHLANARFTQAERQSLDVYILVKQFGIRPWPKLLYLGLSLKINRINTGCQEDFSVIIASCYLWLMVRFGMLYFRSVCRQSVLSYPDIDDFQPIITWYGQFKLLWKQYAMSIFSSTR